MKSFNGSALGLTLIATLSAPFSVSAQGFTKADSGWVRVFNGTDFTGFYSRTYNSGGTNAPKVVPPGSPYTIEYPGTDTATIRVGTTANQGNIGTLDTTFSHYRLRWEMKHDVVNGNNNAGLTYHVDESAIRMQNNWPRSIEFQGKQSEVGSAFSIQQVTFTTRASGTGAGSNYVSTGGSVVQACEYGCNGRWYKGNPLIPAYESATPTVTRWLRLHLILRGADSAIHIVNDTTVMRLWNLRIFNDSTRTTGSTSSGQNSASNNTPARPWDRGGLAWQAEGSLVRYRRLEVMRMPASTPMNEPYLHRLFLDEPAGPTFTMAPTTMQLRWRSIGTIPKVKIDIRDAGGSWNTVTDSTPNTGTYTWTPGVMHTGPHTLDFRISSVDYVWGDSTTNPTSLRPGANSKPVFGKTFQAGKNGTVRIPDASHYQSAHIRDAAGKSVRVLNWKSGSSEPGVWDLQDAQGSRVRPGFYFMNLIGPQEPTTVRVLIF